MKQEDKELLLLKDLCARLPHGVKIICYSWDSDRGCEFSTVETLIGIDDRFIYTLWRGEKDEHSITNPLSITDYKPFLRPMESMTEEEKKEFYYLNGVLSVDFELETYKVVHLLKSHNVIDWLNKNMFDYRGLIPMGLAIEVTKENNPYKN